MFLDAHNLFSDAQAITASAASTNIIDLGAIRDLGVGENLYVVVQFDVAFTDASSNSTVVPTVETDDNASFSSATTGMTLGTFAALTAAGTKLVARLQPGKVNERYMRVYYTVANGDLTTGSFTAYLTKDVQAYTSYADAVTIS